MPHTKRIEIRWRDLDGFGHVNNATYLTYLEEARDQFFTGLLGYERMHRMVVRRVAIEFLSGLVQADDMVDVGLEVTGVGRSSVTTREQITALSDGRVAARAESVMVHCNHARDGSEPLPDDARRLLEALL